MTLKVTRVQTQKSNADNKNDKTPQEDKPTLQNKVLTNQASFGAPGIIRIK